MLILAEKSMIWFLMIFLGLFSFAQAVDYPDEYDSQPAAVSYGRADWQISDKDLAKKIHEEIGPGWFSRGFDEVKVNVQDGVVTLQGFVRTTEDKKAIEQEVRIIKGVKELNNEILIREYPYKENQEFPQDTYATLFDEQLNQKIRKEVSLGWLWNNYKDISLSTSNGIVSLEGNVESIRDQENLINEIQKVEGVKAVKSHLFIKNH